MAFPAPRRLVLKGARKGDDSRRPRLLLIEAPEAILPSVVDPMGRVKTSWPGLAQDALRREAALRLRCVMTSPGPPVPSCARCCPPPRRPSGGGPTLRHAVYDQLPRDVRAKLPLKQIWTLATEGKHNLTNY